MSEKNGELVVCEICKLVFRRTVSRQVVCPTCAPERRKEKSREANRRRRHEEQEQKLRSKQNYTLAEMERAAREHNMTYGKYAAALENGLVDPPKTTKGAGRK